MRRGILLLAVGFALAFAAQADATLVYQVPGSKAILAARDDGSAAHVIAHGDAPRISPDGRFVAFFGSGPARHTVLLVSVRGGHSRRLTKNALVARLNAVVWSPTSDRVLVGGADDDSVLVVDVRRRSVRKIALPAEGYGGASFSPDATQIAVGEDEAHFAELVVAGLDGSHARTVAFGNLPFWGRGGLAFRVGAGIKLKRRLSVRGRLVYRRSANEIPLPVGWARDGRHFLVEQGPDGVGSVAFEAIVLTPSTGSTRRLSPQFSEVDGLSRDGRFVLGVINGNLVAVGSSGTIRALASGAVSGSWTK